MVDSICLLMVRDNQGFTAMDQLSNRILWVFSVRRVRVWDNAEQQSGKEQGTVLAPWSIGHFIFQLVSPSLRTPFVTANVGSRLTFLRNVLVSVRVKATGWDWDRWADSQWLHVFAPYQNALPGGLDLHAAEGDSRPQWPPGCWFKTPVCCFIDAGTQRLEKYSLLHADNRSVHI